MNIVKLIDELKRLRDDYGRKAEVVMQLEGEPDACEIDGHRVAPIGGKVVVILTTMIDRSEA